jgi:hypothetical protein
MKQLYAYKFGSNKLYLLINIVIRETKYYYFSVPDHWYKNHLDKNGPMKTYTRDDLEYYTIGCKKDAKTTRYYDTKEKAFDAYYAKNKRMADMASRYIRWHGAIDFIYCKNIIDYCDKIGRDNILSSPDFQMKFG